MKFLSEKSFPVTYESSEIAHQLNIVTAEPGVNRNGGTCLIDAITDLDATKEYLARFRNKTKTYRSYEKEISRFLIWCTCCRKVPLSSVLKNDCEAYKDFLASIPPSWIGHPVKRGSPKWRPFAGQLSPDSQKYAVQTLRHFFQWLVDARYLHGNPWNMVLNPNTEQSDEPLKVEKAIPSELWEKLVKRDGILHKICHSDLKLAAGQIVRPRSALAKPIQYRIARAAILLMGFAGLRREEACGASRTHLKPVIETHGELWELRVLGKRSKWRTVYLPNMVIEALKSHWEDRGLDFFDVQKHPLLSPVVVPNTPAAVEKHLIENGSAHNLAQRPFTPDGLYQVVKAALHRMASDKNLDLSQAERELLRLAAPHALRHTFATQAAALGMPIDVLQRLLGHVSQATTSLYVKAERSRSIQEVQKIYA